MNKTLLFAAAIGCVLGLLALSFWAGQRFENREAQLSVPFIEPSPSPKPLLAYTIPALITRDYQPSTIVFEKLLKEEPTYTSFLFSYRTLGKKMTGVVNVPTNLNPDQPLKTIVLLRGYVPPENYVPGTGTKNAAAVFAQNGFITFAPDFFGYGESDPEPADSWQARFEKPITVIELLKTLQTNPVVIPTPVDDTLSASLSTTYTIGPIGIWAHSNGGQIALTTLEILGQSIPTTLWAPVSAPFPYSILFFSDETDDEGKAMRLWVSQFEQDYDVFDFSLTRHLDRLQGPLQLHQGTADDAVLLAWSDEFIDKIEVVNRGRLLQATQSAVPATIDINYFTYPGADHNMQPAWATVVDRDLQFFQDHLKDN